MRFEKALTKNDVGATQSHQAGFLVPKNMASFLKFLPFLDPRVLNPSCALQVVDDSGAAWSFRYVYYNNKLHSETGTRNEYRITCTTAYMRESGAREGDKLVFTKVDNVYRISVVRSLHAPNQIESNRIRLKGWQQVF